MQEILLQANIWDILISRFNTYGQSVNITAKYECQISCGAGGSMIIGSNTDPRVGLLQDILMNNHYIAILHDSGSPQDAATKNYVANNTNNREGLVPIQNGNTNNRSGHI